MNVRFSKVLILAVMLLTVGNIAVAKKKVMAKTKPITEAVIVKTINSLVSESYVIDNPNTIFDSISTLVSTNIALNPKVRNNILNHYYHSMHLADQRTNNAFSDSVAISAMSFLLCNPEDDKNEAYTALCDYYARIQNKENLEWALEKFVSYSKSVEGAYDEDIVKLKKDFDPILNPVTMQEAVLGRWVSLDIAYTDPPYQPYVILDVTNSMVNGAMLFDYSNHKPYKVNGRMKPGFKRKSFINPISQGIDFGRQDTPIYRAIFSSYSIKYGNEILANIGHDFAQDFRAKSKATIASSDAKFEDQLVATATTELISSLIESLSSQAATSSNSSEECFVTMNYINKNIMNGYILRKCMWENSHGRVEEKILCDKSTLLVKWEESDSIIFVSQNGQPIFFGSPRQDDQIFDEYYSINHMYSFKNPKYYLPLIAGVSIGVGTLVTGCCTLAHDIKKSNEYRKIHGEGNLKDGKIIASACLISVGIVIPIAVVGFLQNKIYINRNKAYKKINNNSQERLIIKAKQYQTLQISPSINPIDHSYGMSATLSF